MDAQCFGCVDSASYQYHGVNYNGKETAERYIAAYEEMGRPTVSCVTCGSRVKYTKMPGGQWLQVFVEEATQ